MGWDYCDAWRTKADVVADRIRERTAAVDGITDRVLKHATYGNALWTVHETGTVVWIGLDLLACDRRTGCWGYKAMDEGSHPYCYSCPLAYLELAPETCAAWRACVRQWHVARCERKVARAALAVGAVVTLRSGYRPAKVRIESVDPLVGIDVETGRKYRIQRKAIAWVEVVS